MTQSDNAFDALPRGLRASDVATAASLLSRLPLRAGWVKPERMHAAVWSYPLVGACLGMIAALVYAFLIAIGCPAPLSAAVSLSALVLLTGGLHEDGLADTADGLGGAQTKERALDIMKDSRVGSYGVIALVLSILTRWSALGVLSDTPFAAFVVAAAVSRAVLPMQMALMPHARSDGLSHAVGQVRLPYAFAALGIACLIAFIVLGWSAVLIVAVAYICTLPLSLFALKKIGGQTGDILGASQQISEIAVLIALATLL